MESLALLLLLVVGGATELVPVPNTQPPKLRDIVAKYDSLEDASINLDAWKKHTNEGGSIAWNTSYLLESYVDMYSVTSDHKYLDRFTVLADPLLQSTDQKKGAKDYRGRTLVGWGSTGYYGSPQRVVWLVHTGMIVEPLLEFANIVKQDPKLGRYSDQARAYQLVSEAALAEFDYLWRFDSKTGEGYYVFDKNQPLGSQTAGEGLPQPFNMQFAAGRALIASWKLTGTEVHRQKATALARLFKDNLSKNSSGASQWTYWFDRGLTRSKELEDLSHGVIDVSFAVLAEQNDIVFTQADLVPFVMTFFEYSKKLEGCNTAGWDDKGRAARCQPDRDSLAAWITLSDASCRVYDVLDPGLMSRTGRQDARVLWALAIMTQYALKCAK